MLLITAERWPSFHRSPMAKPREEFRRGDAGTGVGGDIGKSTVAVVVVENARFLKGTAEMLAIHFRVDVAIDEENIGPAVVIEVKEHGAPAEVFRVEAEAGGIRDVVECAVAVVAIESGGVVGEICFERCRACRRRCSRRR